MPEATISDTELSRASLSPDPCGVYILVRAVQIYASLGTGHSALLLDDERVRLPLFVLLQCELLQLWKLHTLLYAV